MQGIVNCNFLPNWYVLVATLLVTYIHRMRFCAIFKFLYFVDSDMWLKKNIININNRAHTRTHRMSCCVSTVQNAYANAPLVYRISSVSVLSYNVHILRA